MRKYLQRAVVFFASFVIAVLITWLSLSLVPSYDPIAGSPCDHNCVIPRLKSVFRDNQGRIETHFLGFVEGKYGPRAQFEIVNNGNETAYYAGLARDHNAMETVIINDQKAA